MAVREPRHPLEKRDLLHAETPSQGRIDAVAEHLVEQGRLGEAVDYIEVSRSQPLAARLGELAVERGSAWLLAQVERVTGRPAGPERWEKLAESARGRERWYDAIRALEAAGRSEDAEALRQERCPQYEPFKPLGK